MYANEPFISGLILWIIATSIYGLALWLATEIISIKIPFRWLVIVVVVSSLLALIPLVGGLLATIVGTILLYQLSDSDIGLGHAVVGVILARGVAILIVVGIHSYVNSRAATPPDTVEPVSMSAPDTMP